MRFGLHRTGRALASIPPLSWLSLVPDGSQAERDKEDSRIMSAELAKLAVAHEKKLSSLNMELKEDAKNKQEAFQQERVRSKESALRFRVGNAESLSSLTYEADGREGMGAVVCTLPTPRHRNFLVVIASASHAGNRLHYMYNGRSRTSSLRMQTEASLECPALSKL